MNPDTRSSLAVIVLLYVLCAYVSGHGRLWEPPGRSTMWRKGFKTPHNYDDVSLYCGGFQHQVSQGYKCGVCGDPYDQPDPRDNEAGGKYGNGIITRTYKQGQKVTFTADITANHLGFFEFKICPTNHKLIKSTQDCFDLHPVPLTDGSGSKYTVGRQRGMVDVDVTLPSDLSCDFCVLQWRYHTGNSWGTDPDTGRSGIGYGPQEEFYGCSDIRITPTGNQGNVTTPSKRPTTQHLTTQQSTTQKTTKQPTTRILTTQKPTTQNPTTQKPTTQKQTTQTSTTPTNIHTSKPSTPQQPTSSCYGAKGNVVYDDWCKRNCQKGNCPQLVCECGVKPQITIKPTPKPTTLPKPTTQTPKPTTQTPKPTTQTPKPTTQIPKPTTQTPKPTTQAPKPTTQAPKPTTQTPKPQTYKPTTPQPQKSCYGARGNVVYDEWCKQNCPLGTCPQIICECGNQTQTPRPTTQTPKPTTPKPIIQTYKPIVPQQGLNCYGAKGNVMYNNWCKKNCQVGYCPRLICECGDKPLTKPASKGCTAIGVYRKLEHMTAWCNLNCNRGYCPNTICKC